MDVSFWAATDVGRTRDHNEDNFLVDKKLKLFVVADGMGGHAAGEVASSVAVREVRKVMSQGRATIEAYAAEETAVHREAVLQLIERAIEVACARVYQLAQENEARKGMGTTLSLLLVAGNRGFIGHVGDSRVYLVRRSGVHQITEDHSLINELIKRGRLKPGDVFDSPYKNAVTRAVGVYETVEVDAFDIDILPEDNLLICSDGLSCYLDDQTTRGFATQADIKAIPDDLIRFANDKGGKDNITAIVVRVESGNAKVEAERVTIVQRKTSALQNQVLFRYLSYREVVKLLNIAERRTLAKGDIVCEEGRRSDELVVVLSGALSVSRDNQTIAKLGADDLIGESCLLEDTPRTFTVTADESVEVLVIRRGKILDLMGGKTKLACKVLWSLAQIQQQRIRLASDELVRADRSIRRLVVAGGESAELPEVGVGIQALSATPITVADEVDPPFLSSEQDGPTDPLFHQRDAAGGSTDDSSQRTLKTQPTLPKA